MREEAETTVKALFPEDVEGIYISKNDYARFIGDLTLENIELQQEIERLENIIKEVREYIRNKSMIVQLDNKKEFAIDLYLKEPEYKELLEILDKGE